MKKIMTGMVAIMLLSSVAAHAEKGEKAPAKKVAKTECTKTNCPDKTNCHKTVCPNKPGCICN